MKEKKHPNIKKIKIKYVVVCINPKYVNKLTFFFVYETCNKKDARNGDLRKYTLVNA